MICFFRFRRTTFDLTRGMGRLLRLGLQEALDHSFFTARGERRGAAQVALPLRVLLGEDVALVRLQAPHLPLGGQGEALLRALVGLHLGHAITPARTLAPRTTSA